MKRRVLAIIQARMNSSRLPGKVLLDLEGKAVIHHIIDRVASATLVDGVVVAMTVSALDDPLEEYLSVRAPVGVFRGSDEDVLERFYFCATEYPCDLIVRVTADDPLKDPEIIDEAVEIMLSHSDLDYCSNTLKPSYPEGLDIEVFKSSVIETAHRCATLASEREHVTPYIWKNPTLFALHGFEFAEDLSGWRWTLDKPADFEFIQAVYRRFYRGSSVFSYKEVIDYLKANSSLLEINAGTLRGEGYLRSVQKENV